MNEGLVGVVTWLSPLFVDVVIFFHQHKHNSTTTSERDGVMELHYIPTHEHVVDILTKEFPYKKLEYLRSKICLVDNSSLSERE